MRCTWKNLRLRAVAWERARLTGFGGAAPPSLSPHSNYLAEALAVFISSDTACSLSALVD
jgi:hypothetical protein